MRLHDCSGHALIAAAGVSTALWGCVYRIKRDNMSAGKILADFFRVNAGVSGYLLAALFLLIDFADVLLFGRLSAAPLTFIAIFLKSILFGGIEELGWRYTFQPIAEKHMPYWAASVMTFALWGIWHVLFFCVDGSISAVRMLPFLSGLLTNCFMLSAIYRYKNNLWLCVMTHALINTLAQTAEGGNAYVGAAAKAAVIALSLYIAARTRTDGQDG